MKTEEEMSEVIENLERKVKILKERIDQALLEGFNWREDDVILKRMEAKIAQKKALLKEFEPLT